MCVVCVVCVVTGGWAGGCVCGCVLCGWLAVWELTNEMDQTLKIVVTY